MGHFLRYFDQAIFENFYWTEFLELKLEPFAIGERIWPEFCSESFFGGHSLLATLFGQTLAENAVHCTDLTEDGVLEVQYFFELLQEK